MKLNAFLLLPIWGKKMKFEEIIKKKIADTEELSKSINILPEDSAERKTYPVYSGFKQYFPDAIAAVAKRSYIGNEQHNPGAPLHWDRSKSGDELDALERHIIDEDWDCVAWRAMANLQKQLEKGWRPKDW